MIHSTRKRSKLTDEQKAKARERTRKWRAENLEKVRTYAKKWASENKEKTHGYNKKHSAKNKGRKLERTYGITLAERDAMLQEQGLKCAICSTDEPRGRHKEWHVDHCHKTGEVRGLLCNNCNIGLGLFSDNPSILRSAITYLGHDLTNDFKIQNL